MQSVASSSKSLLRSFLNIQWTSKNFASGRWYPQPERHLCTLPSQSGEVVSKSNSSLVLDKERAAPVYYKPKSETKGYALVPGKKGELLANYPLFEDSINKATVPWNDYNGMTSEERDIYMLHLDTVQQRKLSYIDPKTKYSVFTISHHLQKGKCCGNGCRHCPYGLENATDEVRRSRVWNGAFYV